MIPVRSVGPSGSAVRSVFYKEQRIVAFGFADSGLCHNHLALRFESGHRQYVNQSCDCPNQAFYAGTGRGLNFPALASGQLKLPFYVNVLKYY